MFDEKELKFIFSVLLKVHEKIKICKKGYTSLPFIYIPEAHRERFETVLKKLQQELSK